MNLDDYELINLPIEQLDDLSYEHMGVGMAPTLDTGSMLGLAPFEWSSNGTAQAKKTCKILHLILL